MTYPVGVGDPGPVFGPVTCTPIEMGWPTTKFETTDVTAVVELTSTGGGEPIRAGGGGEPAEAYLNTSKESTAAQKLAVGQETEFRVFPASMLRGDVHVVPLYVTTFPSWSTAAQVFAVGQEIELRAFPGSTLRGDVHVLPL
jgi:hypothetical protein